MKRIQINTTCKKFLADVFTPVGIYLRLRDRFRDTILLESTDHHAMENSWSFICINAIAGIEISNAKKAELKYPNQPPQKISLTTSTNIAELIGGFMQKFEVGKSFDERNHPTGFAQGLFGYTSFNAVGLFERNLFNFFLQEEENNLPLIRYRLYQYVIAINHFKDELFFCENHIAGLPSETDVVESLIKNKDVPLYPFAIKGEEDTNFTDDEFISIVKKGIQHCHRGNVFQLVLSKSYCQKFLGDEFNVYRALRSVNPSPYLFFFDYGDYKLIGSSPEAQLIIKNGKAVVHPIAGTFKRSGDEETDRLETERLLHDAKENAEHVMLVDLARNDLSRSCSHVQVVHFKQPQYYSHVIHLVSEVTGVINPGSNAYDLLMKTFPAGTLSGAPKMKALELISELEPASRGYYGGCIGFLGFDGTCTHAIMIRTLLSKNNSLHYQAGAGIVAASVPQNELQEVKNKLAALKKAIELAETL